MAETRYEFLAAFECDEEVADRFRVIFLRFPHTDDSDADDYWAFTMSENANAPNGVCMTTDYSNADGDPGETERARETLPVGTQQAIANIEAERYAESGDRIS